MTVAPAGAVKPLSLMERLLTIAPALSTQAHAQPNPGDARITNGLAYASVQIPGRSPGAYRGTRFDHAGIVTGLEYDEADKLLKHAHWNVKAAIVMQKSGAGYQKALARLRHAHDFVRDAIGEDVEERLKELLKVG